MNSDILILITFYTSTESMPIPSPPAHRADALAALQPQPQSPPEQLALDPPRGSGNFRVLKWSYVGTRKGNVLWGYSLTHRIRMYATYGNIYHQYTPVMLASIYHTYGSVMGYIGLILRPPEKWQVSTSNQSVPTKMAIGSSPSIHGEISGHLNFASDEGSRNGAKIDVNKLWIYLRNVLNWGWCVFSQMDIFEWGTWAGKICGWGEHYVETNPYRTHRTIWNHTNTNAMSGPLKTWKKNRCCPKIHKQLSPKIHKQLSTPQVHPNLPHRIPLSTPPHLASIAPGLGTHCPAILTMAICWYSKGGNGSWCTRITPDKLPNY